MSNHMDRRQVLAGLGALGAGLVVAACAGNGDDTSTVTTTSTTSGASEGEGATTTTTTSGAAASGAATGAAALADRFEKAASCRVTAELTEGPYYIDVDAIRSDIREDRHGQKLRVGIRVLDRSCQPVPDAIVEIWHCDALGIYSGFQAASTGGGAEGGGGRPRPASFQSDDSRFLRGGQVTNRQGIVEFITIYPGWYRGRTVHIHSKVHLNNRQVLTTQLFFDEDVTAEVYRQQPYASDTGRDTFNDDDNIFDESLVLTTTKEADDYLGLITFNLT